MIDTRGNKIELRSSKKINFKEERLISEIYIKSPNLWKRLPYSIQAAKTKK